MPDPTPGPIADYGSEQCAICHARLALESCWCCMGEGGWHDCEEDTCCCLDTETIDDVCEECQGAGAYIACPNIMNHPREDTPHA